MAPGLRHRPIQPPARHERGALPARRCRQHDGRPLRRGDARGRLQAHLRRAAFRVDPRARLQRAPPHARGPGRIVHVEVHPRKDARFGRRRRGRRRNARHGAPRDRPPGPRAPAGGLDQRAAVRGPLRRLRPDHRRPRRGRAKPVRVPGLPRRPAARGGRGGCASRETGRAGSRRAPRGVREPGRRCGRRARPAIRARRRVGAGPSRGAPRVSARGARRAPRASLGPHLSQLPDGVGSGANPRGAHDRGPLPALRHLVRPRSGPRSRGDLPAPPRRFAACPRRSSAWADRVARRTCSCRPSIEPGATRVAGGADRAGPVSRLRARRRHGDPRGRRGGRGLRRRCPLARRHRPRAASRGARAPSSGSRAVAATAAT